MVLNPEPPNWPLKDPMVHNFNFMTSMGPLDPLQTLCTKASSSVVTNFFVSSPNWTTRSVNRTFSSTIFLNYFLGILPYVPLLVLFLGTQVENTWGQFHRHFTQSFYTSISQKRKNYSQVIGHFALLGSTCAEAFRKHVGEIDA